MDSKVTPRYTICIDFDGTIVDHAFPEIGALKPGAREAITRLHQHYRIVISSCRSSALFKQKDPPIQIPGQGAPDGRDYNNEMHDFLIANGIPFDRIDMGDEGKIVAVAYIDDKGIRFDNNWNEIADQILVAKLIDP